MKRKTKKPYDILKSNLTNRYDLPMDIDYDMNYDGCDCDSICRCGTIENIEFKPYNNIKYWDSIKRDFKDPIDYYIDRLYSIYKIWDPNLYEAVIDDGYYGEEISKVIFENADKILEQFSKLDIYNEDYNFSDNIRMLLELEYGYLLDELKDVEFEVIELNKSNIEFSAKHHYQKLDKNVVDYYKDYPFYRGIVKRIDNSSKYRVIDGYHRLAATNDKDVFEVLCLKGN